MAKVNVIDDRTLKIELSLEDAISMVQQAAGEVDKFASEIITIFEKCRSSIIRIIVFTHLTIRHNYLKMY